MKALVADDSLATRRLLQQILAPHAVVHTCADGAEAVRACTQALQEGHPYDLICLDLSMPTMGGLDALKLIRRLEEQHGLRRPRASKVVIAAAADDKETIRAAFRELCDAYVVKPIDASELLDLVCCLCPTVGTLPYHLP